MAEILHQARLQHKVRNMLPLSPQGSAVLHLALILLSYPWQAAVVQPLSYQDNHTSFCFPIAHRVRSPSLCLHEDLAKLLSQLPFRTETVYLYPLICTCYLVAAGFFFFKY